ncbi:uncharacterized protein MYCGRDRAFT_103089 [Zymoseptoria tritici IPO323]|uniref:Uncharacterized protein n=1 Tax=Zymoseptoria tritici (strain CBS 115943 / IPO323) TaxID=336722 RepID=F9X225_ZYMTI|nr:uncharacterized protein MYCGRDRAFT_103089 [Zymoseptoria tritici IPO323]EGP89782.1 hypothetical protein MYCGRDRAFT_103089 [Zymoseptoria tritici IPO323]
MANPVDDREREPGTAHAARLQELGHVPNSSSDGFLETIASVSMFIQDTAVECLVLCDFWLPQTPVR